MAALEAELRKAQLEGKLPKAEKAAVFDDQFTREVAKRFLPGEAPATPKPESTQADGQLSRFRNIGVGGGPLVVRNQVRLTLEGARTILRAAEEKASSMNLKMNIAVVDDGGHLLAFERMEGARPASGYTSLTKAITAATFRQATGPIPAGTANPDPILNLGLQNAALASGGKITTLYGGVPVTVDGQVIGGVGVGGGSGEQDAQVARAGIEEFLEQLKSHPSGDANQGAGDQEEEGSFHPVGGTSRHDSSASRWDGSRIDAHGLTSTPTSVRANLERTASGAGDSRGARDDRPREPPGPADRSGAAGRAGREPAWGKGSGVRGAGRGQARCM